MWKLYRQCEPTFDINADRGQRRQVRRPEGVQFAGAGLGGAVAPEELVVEEDGDLRNGELAGQQERHQEIVPAVTAGLEYRDLPGRFQVSGPRKMAF